MASQTAAKVAQATNRVIGVNKVRFVCSRFAGLLPPLLFICFLWGGGGGGAGGEAVECAIPASLFRLPFSFAPSLSAHHHSASTNPPSQ